MARMIRTAPKPLDLVGNELEQLVRILGKKLTKQEAKRIMSGKPVVVQLDAITPTMAKKLLKLNKQNRPLYGTLRRALSIARSNNDWKFNGATIRFYTNGLLADGQHRLTMIVDTDIPLEQQILVFNIEIDALNTIDRGGKPRAAWEALQLMGYEGVSASDCAILVKVLGGPSASANKFDTNVDSLAATLELYGEGLKFIRSFGTIKHAGCMVMTPILRAYYNPDKITRERLGQFLFGLKNGASRLGPDSGCGRLRDEMSGLNGETYKGTRIDLYWKTETALRRFANREEVLRLTPSRQMYFTPIAGMPDELKRAAG